MSKARWRTIVVDGSKFEWFVPPHLSYGGLHIRIRGDETGQPVFLDPYTLETVGPRSIADAIRWSLANGWQPTRRSKSRAPMLIGRTGPGEFCVLPKGVRFASELSVPLGWVAVALTK